MAKRANDNFMIGKMENYITNKKMVKQKNLQAYNAKKIGRKQDR